MTTMSYTIFRNTLDGLQECDFTLESLGDLSTLSRDERAAAVRLILLCKRFALDYAHLAEDTA